jgi:hypothetical protein
VNSERCYTKPRVPWKDHLQKRKTELEQEIAKLRPLEDELREVNTLLASLEPPRCDANCPGCDTCRRGPDYR